MTVGGAEGHSILEALTEARAVRGQVTQVLMFPMYGTLWKAIGRNDSGETVFYFEGQRCDLELLVEELGEFADRTDIVDALRREGLSFGDAVDATHLLEPGRV